MEICWSVRGEIYFGNVLEMKNGECRGDEIGCTPSSTGLYNKPVLKVQHRPHLRRNLARNPLVPVRLMNRY